VSQPGAILRSYKDHTEIMAGLHAYDAAAVAGAFDRHIDRIYATTRIILEAMGQSIERP
jgi:hypothetical protein